MEVIDILQKKDIQFQEKGNDYIIRCLNPEHEDSNPSLRVDKITGVFGCFSCGTSGNIFKHFEAEPNFLQIRRNLLRKKLIQKRADTVGLAKPQSASPYLGNHRGISKEIYESFDAFLENEQYPNRIMFPLSNTSDRITAFIGRHTSGGIPKYKVYPPGAKPSLTPAKPLAIENSVLLVEGIYDAMNLHQHGLINAVACFGTQTVTKDKLANLKLQNVDRIDIFLDGDVAGQKAAKQVKELCEELGLITRNVFMKDRDPGELTGSEIRTLGGQLYETFKVN